MAHEEQEIGDTALMERPPTLIDLDTLAFSESDVLMSNSGCQLPKGSYVDRYCGCEVLRVPPLRPMALGPNDIPVKISEMPDWAQPAFNDGMKQLNMVESKVYNPALFTDHNLLVCAPTGAWKTNVTILTILRKIGLNVNDYSKVVYVAPTKTLVANLVHNLSMRLSHYGVVVKELSGDQDLSSQQTEETQIIVTSLELLGSIMRRPDYCSFAQHMKLLIIDGMHLLHDKRGPVLESLIARTVQQSETTNVHIRLVGLSDTLPNYEDVGTFLKVDLKNVFYFDNRCRPIPLAQRYIGIPEIDSVNGCQLMNDLCNEKVISIAQDHPVIIFVHSADETINTARAILDYARSKDTIFTGAGTTFDIDSFERQSKMLKNRDLKDLIPQGLTIYHEGLSGADRSILNGLFNKKCVRVLVSTSTLAWGVNFYAHTVIIKGTKIYNPEKGRWTELRPLDVMQIIEHAGRSWLGEYGEAIFITGKTEVKYYASLMNESLPVESQFISKLADHLNTEIVHGTVHNAREACKWLLHTYLFVRMIRNPTLYGLTERIRDRDPTLEERRADLIHSAATLLDKNNLVKYDRETGQFQVTSLGVIASAFYVTHRTISVFSKTLKPAMSDIELFRLISLSEEFKYVTALEDEKKGLAKLLEKVTIPVEESLEEPSAKISIVLQSYMSQSNVEGFSPTFKADMIFIAQSATRLMRAIFDIAMRRRWARLAEKTLTFCKMIDRRMWSGPLYQSISDNSNELLMNLEKRTRSVSNVENRKRIKECIKSKFISLFPELLLDAEVEKIGHCDLMVKLTITPIFQWDARLHGGVEPFWLIVEDNVGKFIIYQQYIMLREGEGDRTLNFPVPGGLVNDHYFFIKVISDRWVEVEFLLPISLRPLPKECPPFTELLDLQPLPVTALRNPLYEDLYRQFKHFNPIQTQVFTTLYSSDENVLVAAPAGSGKTICAEFAILRNHQKGGSHNIMRVVYVAPIEALAKERFKDWKKKFGKGLGLKVVQLTGSIMADLELVEEGQIIITTAEIWDDLSRQWKQLKHVQEVTLFVIDELHYIGEDHVGHTLEVIVSRIRYISSELENDSRIVALSTSLANANDLGEWIGAPSHGIFCFAPYLRPLDIHVQGVDTNIWEQLIKTMTKPTYTAIVQHAKNSKPAIVFVPWGQCDILKQCASRGHYARMTAVDLMTYSKLDNNGEPKFLVKSNEIMKPIISWIKDPVLKETVQFGVGYLHEEMSIGDQVIVRKLFETGCIQVCVINSSMCWEVSLSAYLVVIMWTREECRDDYKVTHLLEMMGHANWSLDDSYLVVVCHSPSNAPCNPKFLSEALPRYKKLLGEAFSVESIFHLYSVIWQGRSGDVHVQLLKDAEDRFAYMRMHREAVQYVLTWTFMGRRLYQNPTYYKDQKSLDLSEFLANILLGPSMFVLA